METERMFVAVRLPDGVRDHLDAMVEPRRDAVWRWAEAEQFHITLAFYAEVEPWRQDDLCAKLADAASRSDPFPVSVHGVGCLPDVARARVLHAAVSDPHDGLRPLAVRAKNAATTSGIEVAREHFVPHVTLARSRAPLEASRWVRALVELSPPAWDVTEIALVASHLGRGPRRAPVHEVREVFALGAAAASARSRRDAPG